MKIGIRFYWNLDFPKYCNCSASFFFPSAVTLHGTISASLLFPISGHGLRTSIQHSALKMIRAQVPVILIQVSWFYFPCQIPVPRAVNFQPHFNNEDGPNRELPTNLAVENHANLTAGPKMTRLSGTRLCLHNSMKLLLCRTQLRRLGTMHRRSSLLFSPTWS